MTDVSKQISDVIKQTMLMSLRMTDSTKRVSREAAASIAGSDRQARRLIQELRNEGYRICSDSDSPGYYMAQTEADYLRFRKGQTHRAYELLRTVRAMDAGPVPGQMEMEGADI